MRSLKFAKPNFRCTVVDPAGSVIEKLLFAAKNKEELEALLKTRLLKVKGAIEDYDFNDWVKRAKDEAKVANKAKNNNYEYKSKIWTEIKQFLFFLSNQKCGYCETMVKIVSPGDVEHYRPKRKPDEAQKDSGYFWLAYDVTNYVPCCTNCNSARGKNNHFPLAPKSKRATYTTGSKGLAAEKPLLLNPFTIKNPSKHIEFVGLEDPELYGCLRGLTPEGKASVEIYNLNRGDLVLARRKQYQSIKDRLELAKTQPATRQTIVKEYRDGELQYHILIDPVVKAWFAEKEMEANSIIETAKMNLQAFENEKKLLGL